MSTIKIDNNYLPKRMNIILYTKTDKSIRIVYTPQMSIPTTSSKFVNFNPLIKMNKNIFSHEYNINLNEKKALNESIIDVFFNKQKFNDFLNINLVKTGKKELNIQDSCTEKVIDNNIKTTLDILFKPGNILEINKKQYTIFNYSWLDGDWLIYSDDIKKGFEEQSQSYYHRRHYDEETEHKITTKAFDKLNKLIPDCLKGNTIGNSLLITGDKQILEEQQKTDKIVSENKITNKSKIENFFKTPKDLFYSSENNDYLLYNLNYNIPSFLKDPISVSLFYLEYDFIKEITNYKKLEKTFNELEEKKQKLEALEKTIFKYTGSIEKRETITEKINEKKENITKNSNNLSKLKENKKSLIRSLSNYNARTLNLCGYSINSELEQILININSDIYDISRNITEININIDNCTQRHRTYMHQNNKSETINQFNKVINLIDDKIKVVEKKQIEYNSEMNLSDLEEELLKPNIPNYINNKKNYLELCKKTLEYILQKIDMENDYLLLFITFYKQLYTYKKNQLNSTYRLTSDQKWLLTIINQIILFDLIIYNTIYNSPQYKQNVIDTKKSINEYIEKIKKLQTIRYNIKDEKINKDKDLPILSSYKYIIYYVNYVINMNIWEIFSNKTLELYNNFSTIVSKTIQNYHNLNETFSNAPEYESKLKNMKYTCFDLITMYSRMNMICFLRNYICDDYNTKFYNILNQNIIRKLLDTKNKYYLDVSKISKYNYQSAFNNAYLNYINSVKMLTPSITSNSIQKICNKLASDEDNNDNVFFTQSLNIYEFNIIKDHFFDASLNELFTNIGINNIKIIAYTDFKLETAIENGLNWYLSGKTKMFDNKYPLDLDDLNDINSISQYYKINICVIEYNPKKALNALKYVVNLSKSKGASNVILQIALTQMNQDSNSTEQTMEYIKEALIIINSGQSLISQASVQALEQAKKNTTPNLVLQKSDTYKQTLYIFEDNNKYYTILKDDKVALLDKESLIFDNVITDITPQTGGTTQKEQIESIMNQSVLDNLLQNPNNDNDKYNVSKNTLAYIVPIKLELYEGNNVPLNKKVSLNCEENYNNILKAWKVLFKIDEIDETQSKSKSSKH